MEEKIKQIVAEADRDKSGTLDVEEFVAWYGAVYSAELEREARAHFKRLDQDGSGSLDREELRSFVEEARAPLFASRASRPKFIFVFLWISI